jgi:hypothetical protein
MLICWVIRGQLPTQFSYKPNPGFGLGQHVTGLTPWAGFNDTGNKAVVLEVEV